MGVRGKWSNPELPLTLGVDEGGVSSDNVPDHVFVSSPNQASRGDVSRLFPLGPPVCTGKGVQDVVLIKNLD